MNEPTTTTNYIKRKNKMRGDLDAVQLIRGLLSEEFIKGSIIKIVGYEHIDRTWVVEGRDTRMFREREVGVDKGRLVWEKLCELMATKEREYKMIKSWRGDLPVTTIWRVY